MIENKTATATYFDRVAMNYLDRYYSAGGGRYPNLQLRAEIVLDAVTALVPTGGKILDAGCGSGNVAAELAARGYGMSGLDLAPGMVEATRAAVAARLGPDAAVDVRQGDIESLPYPEATFDAVIASGVFEYLSEDSAALRSLRRVLKPNGLALVSFRNRQFNAYSANRYTIEALDAGELKTLLETAMRDIDADAPRIAAASGDVARDWRRAALEPETAAAEAEAPAGDEKFWEKRMERRQHTLAEVEAAADAAGFALHRVFFFHFHPFPPRLRPLMPAFYDQLALAMERFRDTRLGLLMASGFVAVLRAR